MIYDPLRKLQSKITLCGLTGDFTRQNVTKVIPDMQRPRPACMHAYSYMLIHLRMYIIYIRGDPSWGRENGGSESRSLIKLQGYYVVHPAPPSGGSGSTRELRSIRTGT